MNRFAGLVARAMAGYIAPDGLAGTALGERR